MTFIELKEAIITAARRFKMCPEFQDLQLATNYQEFIAAGLSNFEFAYRVGLMSPAILAEFPTLTLQANGIYSGITGTLGSDPSIPYPHYDRYELFIVNGSNITGTFSDPNKYKMNIWDATGHITGTNDTCIDLFVKRGEGSLTLNNQAIGCAHIQNFTGSPAFLFTTAGQLDLEAGRESLCTVNLSGIGFARVTADERAIVNVNTDQLNVNFAGQTFDAAQINYIPV